MYSSFLYIKYYSIWIKYVEVIYIRIYGVGVGIMLSDDEDSDDDTDDDADPFIACNKVCSIIHTFIFLFCTCIILLNTAGL